MMALAGVVLFLLGCLVGWIINEVQHLRKEPLKKSKTFF